MLSIICHIVEDFFNRLFCHDSANLSYTCTITSSWSVIEMNVIRMANKTDVKEITDIIGKAGLNKTGIDDNVENFMVMENESQEIIATVGLEIIERDGMLRSLVFNQGNYQLISDFFQGMIGVAKQKGLNHLYLLTEKEASIAFLELFGFTKVPFTILPAQIKEADHVKKASEQVNPIVMKYTL